MEPKKKSRALPLLLFGCAVCVAVAGFLWQGILEGEIPTVKPSPTEPKTTITLDKAIFEVQVARTPDEIRRGLSGKEALGENEGLWFDFGSESRWGIWMKDMKFSIDIVWLDANRKIVSLAEHISPETYPKVFKPSAKASYVLEVPAGTVEKFGLEEGDEALID